MENETTLKGMKINFETIKWLGIYIQHNKTVNNEQNCYVNLRNLKNCLSLGKVEN